MSRNGGSAHERLKLGSGVSRKGSSAQVFDLPGIRYKYKGEEKSAEPSAPAQP